VLQHVGAHRVAGEVVLDAPDRLESEPLGEPPEAELVRVDLEIRTRRIRALEDQPEPNVHGEVLRQASPCLQDSSRVSGWSDLMAGRGPAESTPPRGFLSAKTSPVSEGVPRRFA